MYKSLEKCTEKFHHKSVKSQPVCKFLQRHKFECNFLRHHVVSNHSTARRHTIASYKCRLDVTRQTTSEKKPACFWWLQHQTSTLCHKRCSNSQTFKEYLVFVLLQTVLIIFPPSWYCCCQIQIMHWHNCWLKRVDILQKKILQRQYRVCCEGAHPMYHLWATNVGWMANSS